MSYSKNQGLRDADAALADYQKQVNLLKERERQVSQAVASLRREGREVLEALTALILPDASDEAARKGDFYLGRGLLVPERDDLEEKFHGMERRLLEIEQDPRSSGEYRDAQAQAHQSLTNQVDECVAQVQEASASLDRYEDPELEWLRSHPLPEGALGRVGEWLVLRDLRRGRAKEAVSAKFGCSSVAVLDEDERALRSRKQDLERAQRHAQRELAELEARLQEDDALVMEHDKLANAIKSHDSCLLANLRGLVQKELLDADPSRLLSRATEAMKPLIGQFAALRDKEGVLGQAGRAIGSQIQDRDQRMNAISRVRGKWRRSSKSYLRSDKSRWLRTLPQAKLASTEHWTDSLDLLLASVMGFDDYVFYSLLLGRDTPFLPFLVFNLMTDHHVSMGFAQQVMPDLQAQLQENPGMVGELKAAAAAADWGNEEQALASVAAEMDGGGAGAVDTGSDRS